MGSERSNKRKMAEKALLSPISMLLERCHETAKFDFVSKDWCNYLADSNSRWLRLTVAQERLKGGE